MIIAMLVELYISICGYDVDMKNKIYSLIVILILISILGGCSIRKNVKTDEIKEFTKIIMESNEKILDLKFESLREFLIAELHYKDDLGKEDLHFLINEFKTLIDIEFMEKLGDEYWTGSRLSEFELRVYIGEDEKGGYGDYNYIISSDYNKTKVSNEEPDNIDGFETWYIFDREHNEIILD